MYVRSTANIPLNFARPLDKAKLLSTITIALCIVSGAWRARKHLGFIFSSTYIWSSMTMVSRALSSSAEVSPNPFPSATARRSSFFS